MKLKLRSTDFSKNIGFYAKLTRKCLICDSSKISSDKHGILCKNCGTQLDYE